jgi:hypothetical protein
MSYLNTIPFYVYRIELKSTGQFYYGSRFAHVNSGVDPIDDLWNIYFTSSEHVKNLINEHGVDAFTAQVLFESDDAEEVFWVEQTYIEKEFDNPSIINKHYTSSNQGHGVWLRYGKKFWINSKTNQTMISIDCPGPDWLIYVYNKGKTAFTHKTTGEIKYFDQDPGDEWLKQGIKKGKPWINTATGQMKWSYSCPGELWILGNKSKGKCVWINTQIDQITVADKCPGPGWMRGNHNSGKTCWTHNLTGAIKWSKTSPGPEWIKQGANRNKTCWVNPQGKVLFSESRPGPEWKMGQANSGKTRWRNISSQEVKYFDTNPGDGWEPAKPSNHTETRKCPHCGKTTSLIIFHRHHNNRCKSLLEAV